jgi:hypothetical protein
MNITIDSQDLLDILLEAGIQTVDAKALILDILTLQENSRKQDTQLVENRPTQQSESRSVAQSAKTMLKPLEVKPGSKPVYGETVTSEEVATSMLVDEDEEDRKPSVTRVQGRSVGTRPKFDGFGGDSTGALRR